MKVPMDLPGADLVSRGLRDLEREVESIAALLVAIGAPRLRALGFDVAGAARLRGEPELLLYRRLARRSGRAAHSEYNALVRQLVSFERAAECRESRRRVRSSRLERSVRAGEVSRFRPQRVAKRSGRA